MVVNGRRRERSPILVGYLVPLISCSVLAFSLVILALARREYVHRRSSPTYTTPGFSCCAQPGTTLDSSAADGSGATDAVQCDAADVPMFDLPAASAILREATSSAYDDTTACEDLGRGCIIGGSLLLYDDRFAPRGGEFSPPLVNTSARLKKMRYHAWWQRGAGDAGPQNPDTWLNTLRSDYDRALRLMPGGSLGAEPPVPFSSCNAPLLLFWDFPENFFHGMAAYTALWHAVRRGALSANASLAIGLPFEAPELRSFLVEAPLIFMRRRITSLSNFAADGTRGQQQQQTVSQQQQQQQLLGAHLLDIARVGVPPVRCFSRLPVCTIATYMRRPPLGMFDFLQAVKDALLARPPNYDASSPRVREWELPPPERPFATSPAGIVRVTLALRRHSGSRRLLNAEELLRECGGEGGVFELALPTPAMLWYAGGGALSAGASTAPRGHTPNRTLISCSMHEWGGGSGLAGDVAKMQATDVLVAVHGAGLTNMGFLRPGASVIEVRPSHFLPSNADRFYRPLARDSSAIKWWGVLTYRGFEVPGEMETAKIGNPDAWARERDVVLPWGVLTSALGKVLPLSWEQWARGEAKAAQTDAIPPQPQAGA